MLEAKKISQEGSTKYFLRSFTFFPPFLTGVQFLKGNLGCGDLMVILCSVFLYFGPVPHAIEYDANYWLLSEARNHMLANWFCEHHLCALNCVKLYVPELLLPCDAGVSPNLMYRQTQRLVT